MNKTLAIFFSLCAMVFVFLPRVGVGEDVESFLKEKEYDYPGCVAIVRNQLFLIPDEQRVAVIPYLFNSCVSGRSLGEKRTKEMYDIPPTAKPKKKSGFKKQVQPSGSLNKDNK
jgi:hypothetical protein